MASGSSGVGGDDGQDSAIFYDCDSEMERARPPTNGSFAKLMRVLILFLASHS